MKRLNADAKELIGVVLLLTWFACLFYGAIYCVGLLFS